MLPRADIIAVSPVGAAVALARTEGAGDARQELFQRSLAGLLGKSMQGEVLSKLTDGSFIVRVAGAPARMLLPPGAQVGAEVPLTLVALTPRPTFQIGSGDGGQHATTYAEAGPALPPGSAARADPLLYLDHEGTPTAAQLAAGADPGPATAAGAGAARGAAQAAALAGKAAPAGADRLAAAEPDDTTAVLSPAARAITGVLGAALNSPTQQSAIIARIPLLAGPPASSAQLAAALQDAIGASGLFYEAHLAEWSGGQRTLAELAREPQMQQAFGSAVAGFGAAPADPVAAQFVNLQLSAHEQAHLAWQGQLWPGQDLHWEIHKDAPQGGRGQDGAEPAPGWSSALKLRFPLLGEIAARVVLSGDQLHIELQAGSGSVGSLLRAHADALASALEAGGAPLASLNIQSGSGDD